MKRFRFVTILVVMLLAAGIAWASPAAALAPAGEGWYWQNPLPFGWNGQCADWGDSQNVWVGTSEGVILHSSDAGVTWAEQTASTPGMIRDISFGTATTGCALVEDLDSGQDGLIYTTDGGATWKPASVPEAGIRIAAVELPDAAHGYAIGTKDEYPAEAKLILVTADGGATWETSFTRATTPFTSGYFNDVAASDAQHAWVVGDYGKVRVTSDGGATWQARNCSNVFSLDHVVAFDGQRAVVQEYNEFFRTSNGGVTWSPLKLPSTPRYCYMAADGLSLVIANEEYEDAAGYGVVLVSDDLGATFDRSYLGAKFLVVALAFDGSGSGVGAGGLSIWRKPAAGDWERLTTAPDYSLNDVEFVDASRGWVVGGSIQPGWQVFYGRILHTDDGTRWVEQQLPDGASLNAVSFVDASEGWAAGAAGRVVHTTDGGATWTDLDTGYPGTIEDIVFLDQLHGWAACSGENPYPWLDLGPNQKGAILKTADGGLTWSVTTMPSGTVLQAIWFVSPLEGWAAGETDPYGQGSYLLHTTDGGSTWERVELQLKRPLEDVTFADQQHGWLVAGQGSTVARTTDGGATWSVIDLPLNQTLASIQMTEALNGWAVGSDLFTTTDGGATWVAQNVVSDAYQFAGFSSFDRIDASHMWAVGTSGRIVGSVDSSSDTASPATVDDGDRQPHNSAVTVNLRATDIGGSSVARTEYLVDAERAWRTGSDYTFFAPSNHMGDGVHWLTYRSVDSAGNIEHPQYCKVTIDTTGPITRSWPLAHGRVARGDLVRFNYMVTDQLSEWTTARLVIERRRASGALRIVRSLDLGYARTSVRYKHSWRVDLRSGTYAYHVEATDMAGNLQASSGETHYFRVM